MTSTLTTILSTLLLGKFTLGALSDSVPRSQWGQGSPSPLVASCLFSLQSSAQANSTLYAPTPHHARLRMLPHHQQLFKKVQKPKPSINGTGQQQLNHLQSEGTAWKERLNLVYVISKKANNKANMIVYTPFPAYSSALL